MILTEKMEYVSAIIFSEDIDLVTKTLLDLGVVEFTIDQQYISKDGVRKYFGDKNFHKIQELRKRCGAFLELANVPLPDMSRVDVREDLPSLDIKKVEFFTEDLSAKIGTLRDYQRTLQQRINELLIFKKRLSGNYTQHDHSLVGYKGFIVPAYANNLRQKLHSLSVIMLETPHIDSLEIIFIFNKSNASEVMKILDYYRLKEFTSIELHDESLKVQLSERLEEMLNQYTEEQQEKKHQISQLMEEKENSLKEYWLALRAKELYIKIQNNFSTTSTTAIFSGWIPSSVKNKVVTSLIQVTHNRVIIESQEGVRHIEKQDINLKLDPPTKLSNNKFSKPYELLVNTYGIVKYGFIDPTFMVSIFFTLMFGLMFADAGQGMIIVVFGIFLLLKSKKSLKKKEILQNVGNIVMYCGLSSVFFGVMFSSYFGLQLFPPLWFDLHGIAMTGKPHYTTSSAIRSIGAIFVLSFKFGFLVLGVGLLFNFINKIRSRQYFELFFSANGILGALFYVASTHMIWFYVKHKNLQNYRFTGLSLGILIVTMSLFMVIPIVKTLEFNKKSGKQFCISQVISWPAVWAFEVFEMITGYFSSTLSFVRVGAIGIVHAVLMGVFYSMAGQTKNIFLSALIVIFVNVLVIGLEGLLAAVNSMRLHFYEFFSRYFESGGRLYRPISLENMNGN